jgi:hypothetical protein
VARLAADRADAGGGLLLPAEDRRCWGRGCRHRALAVLTPPGRRDAGPGPARAGGPSAGGGAEMGRSCITVDTIVTRYESVLLIPGAARLSALRSSQMAVGQSHPAAGPGGVRVAALAGAVCPRVVSRPVDGGSARAGPGPGARVSPLPQEWRCLVSGGRCFSLPSHPLETFAISSAIRILSLSSTMQRTEVAKWPDQAQDVTISTHLTEEGRGGEGGRGKEKGEEERDEEGVEANNLVSWRHVRGRWAFAICRGSRARMPALAQSCASTRTEPSQHACRAALARVQSHEPAPAFSHRLATGRAADA